VKQYQLLERICQSGVIAILRRPQADVVEIAKALRAGGVEAMEITADTPDVMAHIQHLNTVMDGVQVGIGTVLDTQTARQAILAGAKFIITPTLDTDVIAMANRYGTLIIPGVFTPTEILRARECGALAVKVFPAGALGPEYLRQVSAPLSGYPLIPTGGIGLDNLVAFIKAGAVAVGVGNDLVARVDVVTGDYQQITQRAKAYVETIRQARGMVGS
jgi:2-dehydro-3-deoxyphosphogluconate aldolase/(4S)-4-hydroxy-2-oxoglutarate aldolase